jgi:hypothetical protein
MAGAVAQHTWRSVSSARPVRYVAFLRAVNVGGRVVKMDVLRKLFESLGYDRAK